MDIYRWSYARIPRESRSSTCTKSLVPKSILRRDFTTSPTKSGKSGTGCPEIFPSGHVSTTWRGNSTGSRRIPREKWGFHRSPRQVRSRTSYASFDQNPKRQDHAQLETHGRDTAADGKGAPPCPTVVARRDAAACRIRV